MNKNTTLIIGGTKGIGLIIKDLLRERGDDVYTVSRSCTKDPNHFKSELPNCFEIGVNAEISYLIFAHRYRGDEWDEEFHTMVKSVDVVIQHLKKKFAKDASIVILGSNAGSFVVQEQNAAYHATRAAIGGLVKYYGATLGPMGIRCNAVIPNTIIKPENETFFGENNETRKMIERITPLGRMGRAKDVANVVEFLCSEKSSFITGQSIYVDGGLSLVGQESIARRFLL